jgi:hypothetical protein
MKLKIQQAPAVSDYLKIIKPVLKSMTALV